MKTNSYVNFCAKQTAYLATVLCIGFLSLVESSQAQAVNKAQAQIGNYISPGTFSIPLRNYLAAFGDRIQKPGKERTIVAGTLIDSKGSANAQVIWQVPGNIRIDRSDEPGKPLTYDSSKANTSSAGRTQADFNMLESLLDDTAEAFFYGVQAGTPYRLLGLRFRADDGTTVNYQGPWYDVYATTRPSKAQPGNPSRLKHYYFDSQSGFLVKTRYNSSPTVITTTEFAQWTKVNGQFFPGQIVRKENDSVVFTLNVSSVSTSVAASDGAFAAQ